MNLNIRVHIIAEKERFGEGEVETITCYGYLIDDKIIDMMSGTETVLSSSEKKTPDQVCECFPLNPSARLQLGQKYRETMGSKELQIDIFKFGLMYKNLEPGKAPEIAEVHARMLKDKIGILLTAEKMDSFSPDVAILVMSEESSLVFFAVQPGLGENKTIEQLINHVIDMLNRDFQILGATKLIAKLESHS